MNTEQKSSWQEPLPETQTGFDFNANSVAPAIDPSLLNLQFFSTGTGTTLPWPVGQPIYTVNNGFYDGSSPYSDLNLRLTNLESQTTTMGTQISCLEANMQAL